MLEEKKSAVSSLRWLSRGLAATCVWLALSAQAQAPTSRPAPPAAAAMPAASAASTGPATPPASAASEIAPARARPAMVPASGPAAPDLDRLGERIDKLALAVAAAASAAQPNDSWQDVKSVALNVLSNRIDAFLFGGGSGGGVSAGARLLALVALVYAAVKLLLALALLRRGSTGGFWDRVREGLCRNQVLAGVRCVLAVLALAYTGVAYYLVSGTEAAAAQNSAQSIEALRSSLQSCQAQLQARPPAQPATGPAPVGVASAELMATVARQAQACTSALRNQDATLARLQEQVQAVSAAQPGGLSKGLTFLAWVFALGALAALLWRSLR